MNEYENNNTAVESEKTATQAPETPDVVNIPEDKKNVTAGMYNHKFKKPFEFEDVKHVVINFDFEKLRGRDVISIEAEMQANNEYVLDPLLSRNFQSKMAARAGGISTDALEAMPIQEFNKITNAARNFLIDSGY